jgi:hypothetical protein
MNLRKSKIKPSPNPNYAELEKLARKQGVEPFDFDEAVGEGASLWTDAEFKEFERWIEETRASDTIRENSK